MGFLAQSGFKANKIIASMPGVLDLAAASQLDLASTADIASNIMTGFGIEAEDMGRVVDVLTKTMTTANTDLNQLSLAMKYISPVANAMGWSIEETAAAVGRMSDAGVQASQAGTSLRAGLGMLNKPAAKSAKLMDELGINVKNSAGEMKSMPELIGHLNDRMKDMNGTQKAATMAQLVGTESMSGFIALLNVGQDELASYTNELENSAGTAAEVAKVQNDTLIGSFKSFQSAMQEVGISIGNEFLGPFREIVEAGTELVRMFGDINPALIATGLKSTAAAAGFALAATSMIKLSRAIKLLYASMGPTGWLILGLSVAAGLLVGVRDEMARNSEVSLENANALKEQADSTEQTIEKFEGLRNKMQLTTDELARFVDINSELNEAIDPAAIERLKDEQAALLEKSGLSNDQMSEYLRLNDEVIKQAPQTEVAISKKGTALAQETESLRKLNVEQRAALRLELDNQKAKAEANYNDNLAEQKRLLAEINADNAKRQELEKELSAIAVEQAEAEAALTKHKEEGNAAGERAAKANLIAVEQRKQALLDERAQLLENIQTNSEDLKATEKKLSKVKEINSQMAQLELTQTDITAAKGDEINAINEAIIGTQLQIDKIRTAAEESGGLTQEQKEQLGVLGEQLGSYQAVRDKIVDIYGETAAASAEAELLNGKLGEYIEKKFDVEDREPYAEKINSTLAEYIMKEFNITDKNSYADMINDKLMREIFKEFGITSKEDYVNWVNTNLEAGIFKDFDVTNKMDYVRDVNAGLEEYVYKDFEVTNHIGYADTLNQKLGMSVTKGVSIIESISRNVTTNFYGGNRPQQHQGGIARDAKPKFHEGGVPGLREFPKLHNEVDIRALKNEMILTEAQQSQLFRLLSSYTPASKPSVSDGGSMSDAEAIRYLGKIARNTEQNSVIEVDGRKLAEATRKYFREIEKDEIFHREFAQGLRRRF